MIYHTSKLFFMFYFAKLTESNTSSAIKMRCAVARAEPESVKCTRIRMIQTGHDDVLRTRMATIPFILSELFPLDSNDRGNRFYQIHWSVYITVITVSTLIMFCSFLIQRRNKMFAE